MFSKGPTHPNPNHHGESLSVHPLQVEEDEDPQTVDASALLPHEIFGSIYRMGESKAWDLVSVLKKYWCYIMVNLKITNLV